MPFMSPRSTSVAKPIAAGGGSPTRNAGESQRAWPRYEAASTHFELGGVSDYRPTAVMAKRYTPKHGVRKE